VLFEVYRSPVYWLIDILASRINLLASQMAMIESAQKTHENWTAAILTPLTFARSAQQFIEWLL
jgi:Ni/Fe-hydrogenase subunit HybB-like protein